MALAAREARASGPGDETARELDAALADVPVRPVPDELALIDDSPMLPADEAGLDARPAEDLTDPATVVPLLTRTADPAGDWKDRALCAETDPEAFFPEKGGSTREAKRICTSCDVRVECLGYALAHDERFGIWGGLSERERRRLKKRVG